MRTYNSLPKLIKSKGKQYKRAETPDISSSDEKQILQAQIAAAKKAGKSYKTVHVLSNSLRNKLDLHGKPYKPTTWIFVEQ